MRIDVSHLGELQQSARMTQSKELKYKTSGPTPVLDDEIKNSKNVISNFKYVYIYVCIYIYIIYIMYIHVALCSMKYKNLSYLHVHGRFTYIVNVNVLEVF